MDINAREIIRIIENERGTPFSFNERFYVNYIVSNLKAAGVWSKCNAIYGMVGGTAAAHKWNWKDMRDLDAAFRLSFQPSGWSHTSTGAKPNGTTYAQTFLNPSTQLVLNNTHISYFSGTNVTSDVYTIVAYDGTSSMGIYANFINRIFNSQYNGGSGRIITTETRGDGYFIINRQSASLNQTYKDGRLAGLSTVSTSLGALPNSEFIIGAIGAAVPENRSLKEAKFISIGDGLTDTQAIQISHIITFAQVIRTGF
jgi:hypothetical protein